MFEVSNRNTRKRCKIFSKLAKLLLNIFHTVFIVFIIYFEQEIVCWKYFQVLKSGFSGFGMNGVVSIPVDVNSLSISGWIVWPPVIQHKKKKMFSQPVKTLKVNNRNTRKRCEISSKLAIKTLERRHWDVILVLTLNHGNNISMFEHISKFVYCITIPDFEQVSVLRGLNTKTLLIPTGGTRFHIALNWLS